MYRLQDSVNTGTNPPISSSLAVGIGGTWYFASHVGPNYSVREAKKSQRVLLWRGSSVSKVDTVVQLLSTSAQEFPWSLHS